METFGASLRGTRGRKVYVFQTQQTKLEFFRELETSMPYLKTCIYEMVGVLYRLSSTPGQGLWPDSVYMLLSNLIPFEMYGPSTWNDEDWLEIDPDEVYYQFDTKLTKEEFMAERKTDPEYLRFVIRAILSHPDVKDLDAFRRFVNIIPPSLGGSVEWQGM